MFAFGFLVTLSSKVATFAFIQGVQLIFKIRFEIKAILRNAFVWERSLTAICLAIKNKNCPFHFSNNTKHFFFQGNLRCPANSAIKNWFSRMIAIRFILASSFKAAILQFSLSYNYEGFQCKKTFRSQRFLGTLLSETGHV